MIDLLIWVVVVAVIGGLLAWLVQSAPFIAGSASKTFGGRVVRERPEPSPGSGLCYLPIARMAAMILFWASAFSMSASEITSSLVPRATIWCP